jgi:anti-sigma B factor antagonist
MLHTAVQEMDGIPVVQILSDIVQFNNYQEIYDKVRDRISDACCMAVLDLSRVKFMDSISLGMLVPLVLYARRVGGDLKLSGLSSDIRALFKVLLLDRVIDVFPDAAAAVASFHVE